MRIVLLFIALNVFALSSRGQSSWERQRDSLQHLLVNEKEDTVKAIMLLDIGWTWMNSNVDSAQQYFSACNELSKKLNFAVGELRYRFCSSQILYMQGKYNEQLAMDLETPDIALQTKSPDGWLLSSYSNIANDYVNVNRGDKAMEYYQKTIALSEKTGKKKILSRVYSNMVGYYRLLGIHPNAAYQYGLQAIKISRENDQQDILDEALSHTGHVLIDLKKYDSALLLQQQAGAIAEKIDDKVFQTEVLMHINELLIIKQDYEGLKANADKILSLSAATDNAEGKSYAYYYTAAWYFYHKDYAGAKVFVDSSLQVSISHKNDHAAQPAYLLLSDICLAQGDLPGFRKARMTSDSLSDVFESAELIKNAQEIEGKYSLDKKQAEIDRLQDDQKIQQLTIRQTRIMVIALCIILAIAILLTFLLLRNQQQKRKLLLADAELRRQKIAELENEKQLLAAEAVLQGHEEERTRIAKDLHDGLGGILSGVKYSLNNMKDNFIITPESAAAFDRSMVMLDRSITELRAVSHNMMPEALIKFGLDTALRDYCNSLNQSGAVKLSYQSFDLGDGTVPAAKASVIYRIVQELTNNIMKHAGAQRALVQIIKKNEGLSITVEDDGKGFDATVLQENKGIGYANLQNRVTYLKGTMDLHTSGDKGTSVNIEIPDINA